MSHNSTTTSYFPEGMPLPAPMPDGLDAPFWEGTKRHKLLTQRCQACSSFQFGPEWICHKCRSGEIAWVECSGRGKVYAFERVWHPVHKALKDSVPYLIVLVELPDAGNVRMVGNLLGDPRQDVKIGDAVSAVWEDHADVTLVQWQRRAA